jgi:hypothetical protein
MNSKNVQSLFKEYSIELDDIRWYLSRQSAMRLLEYRDKLDDLSRLIWSGRLEADLYAMEERFVDELQEKLDKRRSDESEIRKLIAEIEAARTLR